MVLAVLGGLALAALAASRIGLRRGFLLTVVVIGLAWAALDIREVVHQLDESRTGVAMVAMAVAALHLAVAAISGRLATQPPATPSHAVGNAPSAVTLHAMTGDRVADRVAAALLPLALAAVALALLVPSEQIATRETSCSPCSSCSPRSGSPRTSYGTFAPAPRPCWRSHWRPSSRSSPWHGCSAGCSTAPSAREC